MSQLLEKAREFEQKELNKINMEERPLFHFSNPVGWMNDPNGFSDYHKEHHLFFQYYPYETRWNSMHWGHAKSKDFIKWEYLPVALAPDQEYDSYGVFSGSAIEDKGKQVLVYTGVNEILKDGKAYARQNQCVAIGDGINYQKIACNPVVRSDMLPEGSSREDFRDPKIWKEEDKYYMVVGSRGNDGSGQVALFSADQLDSWKFVGIIDKSANELGKMWECPDFYQLEEKYVLMVSPQEMEAKEREFHSGNNSVFLVGTYCKCNYKFNREKIQNIDYGLDFYAPQTMQTEDGRRILIGWMQSWDNPIYQDIHGWSGMMTIPRELTIKEGHICQWPVRELEKYRTGKVSYENVVVGKEFSLADINGRSIDMEIQLTGDTYQKYKIKLAAGDSRYSEIIYNRKEKVLTFDRTYSGLKRDVTSMRSMYVEEENGMLSLRVLVDKYSVEIFVNNGEQVMTSLIYTPLSENSISFSSDGEACMNITKYNIEV